MSTNSINDPYSTANFLSYGWRGNVPLTVAFFAYYVVGRILTYGLAYLAFTYLGFFGWFLGIVVLSGYWLWSLVVLWRCAHNTQYAALFYAARAIVFIDILYSIYNPPLFAFNS
ncbi:MAG: hypothetical protein AAFN50_06885 [Pseudomonadota bacterium]